MDRLKRNHARWEGQNGPGRFDRWAGDREAGTFQWRPGPDDGSTERRLDDDGPSRLTLSVVLPVLNEEESLPALVARIVAVLREALADGEYELVFVDDGSRDDSWRVISSFVRSHPNWQGVRLTRRFGHQAA